MSVMKFEWKSLGRRLPAIGVFIFLSGIWLIGSSLDLFPPSLFPSPISVVKGFQEEIATGRLFTDMNASLYRVTAGFVLAAALGIPLGLVLGRWVACREALLPCINFFRNLSPLAWIPFAILWFGIGDSPAVFLIFMAAFFPMVLSTLAAVSSIPALHFRVARDLEFSAMEVLTKVTLPAIAPQVITTLRLTAGLSWLVVVAAEMIVGRDGLGFAVWDARNGLRTDLLVVAMVAIGTVGILLDWGLRQLSTIPSVRWGYEQ